MLANKLLASAGGVETLYVDDLFQAHTRTGTGASATVTTGINLSVKGGMIWSKGRSGATDHAIYDTSRGATFDLASNMTSAQTTQAQGLTAFGTTGHTWGTLAKVNTNAATYVDYVFAKAPKFFDVVTYTGNAGTKAVPHSLGSAPAMIIVKKTNVSGTASDWVVYHQAVPANCGFLNATSSFASAQRFSSVTASDFTINVSTADVNENSSTYVAYLFAHDPSADGIIQCGSFTVSSGTGTTEVNLGWEPQFLLTKYNQAGYNWNTYDASRGWTATTTSGNVNARLSPNLSAAEATDKAYQPCATGFRMNNAEVYPGSPVTVIYLAIRRPNKPPTTGTQVYNAIARTGTGGTYSNTGAGFAPDLVVSNSRNSYGARSWFDRLRGGSKMLLSNSTAAEGTDTSLTSFDMAGFTATSSVPYTNDTGQTYSYNFFKRAPGVLSQICYSGTGANKTEAHDLGVAPELWLVKGRSGATQWVWGSSLLAATEKIVMPTPAGKVTDATAWNSTYPTSSVLSLGTAAAVNTSTATYTAYLWATKVGISKVFAYTGNGTSLNVDCGFTTGARFILIVRTSASGSVYVWDTVRGVIAGNDPYLALDTTAAEVTTDDSVDPLTSGFTVNQVAATNINVNGATYLGLAYS